jgi:hypothetical protein
MKKKLIYITEHNMKDFFFFNLKIVSILKTTKIEIGINNYDGKKNYSTHV